MQDEEPTRVFAWLLSRTEDTFGNAIRYVYRPEPGTGPVGFPLSEHGGSDCELGREHHQRYLSRVEYVEIDDSGERFLYSVDLDYGEYDDDGDPTGEWAVRPDRFSFYRAGFEVRTVRRCERVLVRVHEPGTEARLLRSYDLHYDNSSPNGISLLRSIQVTGYAPADPEDIEGTVLQDGTRVVGRHRALLMPPLELSYSDFAGRGSVRDLTVEAGALPPGGLDHPDFELIDLDGYGLPGIIWFGAARNGAAADARHRYWANVGGGRVSSRDQAGPPVSFADPDVNFADMTGEGTADLVFTTGDRDGFYETWGGRGWTDAMFRPFVEQPTFDLKDPRIELVDTDGDGRVDVLDTSGDHVQLYVNSGDHWRQLGVDEQAPEVSLGDSNGAVRLADMSGDGPLDIVRVLRAVGGTGHAAAGHALVGPCDVASGVIDQRHIL